MNTAAVQPGRDRWCLCKPEEPFENAAGIVGRLDLVIWVLEQTYSTLSTECVCADEAAAKSSSLPSYSDCMVSLSPRF